MRRQQALKSSTVASPVVIAGRSGDSSRTGTSSLLAVPEVTGPDKKLHGRSCWTGRCHRILTHLLLRREPPMKDTIREHGGRTTAAPRNRNQACSNILLNNRGCRTRASGGRGNKRYPRQVGAAQRLFHKTGEVASIPQKRPQPFIHV